MLLHTIHCKQLVPQALSSPSLRPILYAWDNIFKLLFFCAGSTPWGTLLLNVTDTPNLLFTPPNGLPPWALLHANRIHFLRPRTPAVQGISIDCRPPSSNSFDPFSHNRRDKLGNGVENLSKVHIKDSEFLPVAQLVILPVISQKRRQAGRACSAPLYSSNE